MFATVPDARNRSDTGLQERAPVSPLPGRIAHGDVGC